MATILETITIAAREFEHAGVDSPRLTAELLLAHALGCRRLDLYLKFDQPLEQKERLAFGAMYKRRIAREPLQYIVAEQDFCGLTIGLDAHVLIPRPETEELVEQTVARAALFPNASSLRILDIGTGSGCIALALAARLAGSAVEGIDIAPEAVALAMRNAARNGVTNATFRVGDILRDGAIEGTFDIIVSNPPYVPRDEWEKLDPEVRDHEPRHAVTDGADGLTFYRRIAEIGPAHLAPHGCIAVEIGYGQATAVRAMFEARGMTVEIADDLAGVARMVFATCAR